MRDARRSKKWRGLRGEDGMSMIEVLVATMVLALGSLAVLNLVGTSARNTYRSEAGQVVSNRLQAEMEKIKQIPYDQLALTGLPADSPSTANPSWRRVGTSFAVNQNGTQLEPLVYDGSGLYEGGTVCDTDHACGAINPTPTSFTSGDVHGTIYRFVTWEGQTCPDSTGVDRCPGDQDLKRVIVAIRLDTTASGGARHYQELQSKIVDPAATVRRDEPLPPGQAPSWTFWLTDTPCNYGDRQDVVSDHAVHNTRGVCSNQLQNANTPGAPDLMVTHAPPLISETPLFNYATDVTSRDPSLDKGLRLLKPSTNGCPGLDIAGVGGASDALSPSPKPYLWIHKWLAPPIPTGFNVQLNGSGALDLWTQSIDAAAYSGKICIWLFQRHNNALGVPIDTPAVNLDLSNALYFQHSESTWPTTLEEELHIPLNFTLNALTPGSQLGLAIAVEKAGTSCTAPCGLQFLYDEPSFDSRLELKTSTTLLPF